MPSTSRLPALVLALVPLLALAGCGSDEGRSPDAPRAAVPAPLPAGEAAYEIAGSVALAEVAPPTVRTSTTSSV